MNENIYYLKLLHKELLLQGEQNFSSIIWNNLIISYYYCGYYENSIELYSRMPNDLKNRRSYNQLLLIYSNYRMISRACELFKEMETKKFINEISIAIMMHAYSHVLCPEQSFALYKSMEDKYGIKPSDKHHTILVDAFGRFGMLDEAEKYAQLYPSLISWSTLLGACRLWHDASRAKRVASHIISINKEFAPSYVLLGNVFGLTGNWMEQKETFDKMKKNQIKKTPGKSWLVINGITHEFLAHESEHPEIHKINILSKKIVQNLQKHGYNPNISWVSKNISNDLKIKDLCEHSERYALVYALMNLPQDEPLIIFKNLRVCGDCHEFTKYFSFVYNKEIRLRDAAVWHIFKNGKCACNDNY
eukprot:TRINITY_DN6362_c0_g5_i1.p1 TRINITY_DN6362_c0_g5~~TRINITY_DN6362_c0_g5_i1.p1  ORF type:complete len:406 (-),score=74.33 TRINITY_DN6362_c0_g5_i1:91-1173(-)